MFRLSREVFDVIHPKENALQNKYKFCLYKLSLLLTISDTFRL